MTKIRKGQAPAPLTRVEFRERFNVRFYDPAYEAEREAIARLEAIAWKAHQEGRKAPITRPAGRGFADSTYPISLQWLKTRKRLKAAQKRWNDNSVPSRVLIICGSARNDGTCPGEISKTWRFTESARHVVQGLGAERDAAVPLAMQLLSEPFAGPGRRLDGRDLRALGRSARCNHPRADLLVPVAEPAETHDRSDGLRRWRQSRSELDARQEGRRGEAHRAKGLGLPETPGRAGVWRRRAWRRGRRRVAPPQPDRLARMDGIDCRRRSRQARSLHRLLRTVLQQPRHARQGQGRAGRGAQCGALGGQCGVSAARHIAHLTLPA